MSQLSIITGRVGPVMNADGTNLQPIRTAKSNELCVTQAHGKYYEAAHRGVLFAAQEQGSGVAGGHALSTTALLTLYNPQGSGKRLSINKVSLGYISGTLGVGTFYHCINNSSTQTAPSGGTSLTPVASDIGNTATPVAKALVNNTVVTPVAYRAFAACGAFVGGANNAPAPCTEDIDGEIVVEPGCTYQLQFVGTGGTSPALSPGITWEEIQIV